MSKTYAQMTPREHIIATVVSKIKSGRASDIHATIEGLAAEGESYARAGHNTTEASIYQWYGDATDTQIDRLIRDIKKQVAS